MSLHFCRNGRRIGSAGGYDYGVCPDCEGAGCDPRDVMRWALTRLQDYAGHLLGCRWGSGKACDCGYSAVMVKVREALHA